MVSQKQDKIIRITRSQYPVGQGCFHAGHIRWGDGSSKESGEFHYVYDCGSTNQKILNKAIGSYRKKVSHIDALFVSHLDADHVNGLDCLLAEAKIDTVFIPYVDNVVPILDLIEASLNGTLSASLVQASLNPRFWFGSRGVSRVIQVLPSRDPETDGTRDDRPDDRGWITLESPAAVRSKFTGQFGARPAKEEIDSGIRVQVGNHDQDIDWVLVPHVDLAPVERLDEFKRAVREVLDLLPGQKLIPDRLADALRKKNKRNALKECYKKIIGCHNRVSMSLYSGPDRYSNRRSWEYRICGRPEFSIGLRDTVPLPSDFYERSAVGWIGTGDAGLDKRKVRLAWERTYWPFRGQILTLLLPHHGSQDNFHDELLGFSNLDICVASAGAPSPYKHPSHTVVEKVRKKGKALYHVSQGAYSGIQEEIRSM